jgi:hypothetical protein
LYNNLKYCIYNTKVLSIHVEINGIISSVPFDTANTDFQNIVSQIKNNTLQIPPYVYDNANNVMRLDTNLARLSNIDITGYPDVVELP